MDGTVFACPTSCGIDRSGTAAISCDAKTAGSGMSKWRIRNPLVRSAQHVTRLMVEASCVSLDWMQWL
eukprot:6473430-Amphidinium_carterae.1